MLALLAGAALRSVFLAAAVGTGLRLLRKRDPRVPLMAWTLVLAASLSMPVAMPLTSIAFPHGVIPVEIIPVEIIPAGIMPAGITPAGITPAGITPAGITPAGQPPLEPDSMAQTETSPVTPHNAPSAPAAPSGIPPASQVRWSELASFVYLAVSGALTLRLLSGLVLSWRIVRDATRVREDWVGHLDVRVSQRVDAPATFGSVILVPGDHPAWTPAKRLAVLAHEGAHVARHDFAIQLAAGVNRMVFWFNPFSWWLWRHLSDLAEAASDDAAVAGLDDRFGYAEILLEMSGRVSRLPSGVSMARRAAVGWRIERILSETPPAMGMSRRDRAMLSAGIVPLAVALSFLIILPVPPSPQRPLAEGVPAAVEIVIDEGGVEGPKQPATPDAPAIVAAGMTSPTPVPIPTTEVASPPPRPSTPPPLSRAATSRHAPRLLAGSAVTGPASRAMRQPDSSQEVSDRSPGPKAVNRVGTPSYSANGPDRTTGATGQSPSFKTVANQTCRGTYQAVWGGFFPILAQFHRGPGDAPWVTFNFAARRPAELPVTINGSEIRFASSRGEIYTLSPSGNMLLPPRYHRLTGSAEHPSGGTVELACGASIHPL
jgi:hypothetical protein